MILVQLGQEVNLQIIKAYIFMEIGFSRSMSQISERNTQGYDVFEMAQLHMCRFVHKCKNRTVSEMNEFLFCFVFVYVCFECFLKPLRKST